jgi:aminopeptidase N
MSAQSPPAAPAPGVPLSLAQQRARQITNVGYRLILTIPERATEPVKGRVFISFDLAETSQPVVLDFAGPRPQVWALGHALPQDAFRFVNEHIILPPDALHVDRNTIVVDFTSNDAALNRNPDYLYALFVPARAHLAFPCFDQPDIKAGFDLTLNIPENWQALSNGQSGSAPPPRDGSNPPQRVHFGATRLIPTYLFTFAAGKFQIEEGERNGRHFRMFHRETDAAKVARNKDAIFDLHAAALKWLEDYTGIPYPFGKFDFLLVPSFQFGGMEHPGAIYYNASGLMLDESATQNQKLGRASVIAHETAHMWFGDLVTMKWFNDVWMKEVFANFMAAKIVNPSFPGINHELRFLYSNYPAAYSVDRTAGSNPIRQQLDNLNEAGTLYGAIIYQKAPIVMRQLEMIVGEVPFRDGLREYLKAHAFGNATWPDLIAVLGKRTKEDLAAWSHAWVEEAGRPTIEVTRTGDAVHLSQKDPIAARGLTWSQKTVMHTVLNGAVLPSGYGDFVLDKADRKSLLAHLKNVPEPLLRGIALVTLWEEMLDGRVKPADMLDMLVDALPTEQDELNIQQMLGYTRSAYWNWIDANERKKRAPSLEKLFRYGLDSAKTPSLKSAWFSALRDVAATKGTLDWLERVWRKTETVPGLTLAEPDYIALAQELALKDVPHAAEILDTQFARIENPDRKARFAFVRPSLSPDQATRDALFESFRKVENRRREPWVLEALGFMHHPLRAVASDKYIRPSLELLREIQQTGDIFFPKRWMDATLSGHTSAGAAQTVRDFLATLPPDYPDRLRRVILSSADDLFRVTRVAK